MFFKALGVKYLSRYRSYYATWECQVYIQGDILRFRVEEMLVTVDRKITGRGSDELGDFKILGTVNKYGFAEFEKRYNCGSLKPVTAFTGNFQNSSIVGTWHVKGQGSGKFDMQMMDAKPFVFKNESVQETIFLAFIKNGSRVHSVGMLPDPKAPGTRRFYILNGKIWDDGKNNREIALKIVFPDSPEQEYYLGVLENHFGGLRFSGSAETHKTNEWFAKATTQKFEMLALPPTPVMPHLSAPQYYPQQPMPFFPPPPDALYPPPAFTASQDFQPAQGPPFDRELAKPGY